MHGYVKRAWFRNTMDNTGRPTPCVDVLFIGKDDRLYGLRVHLVGYHSPWRKDAKPHDPEIQKAARDLLHKSVEVTCALLAGEIKESDTPMCVTVDGPDAEDIAIGWAGALSGDVDQGSCMTMCGWIEEKI